MKLVEGPFTQQHDQLRCLECTRTAIEVVVHETATRKRESLVESTQLAPHRPDMKRALLSPIGPNQPRPDDPARVLTSNSL